MGSRLRADAGLSTQTATLVAVALAAVLVAAGALAAAPAAVSASDGADATASVAPSDATASAAWADTRASAASADATMSVTSAETTTPAAPADTAASAASADTTASAAWAGATTDAAGAAATRHCSEVEAPAVVATPPEDAPYRPGDTVRVYRGSELVVHSCQAQSDDEGQPATDVRLDASAHDWIEPLSASGDRMRIRITGPASSGDADEQRGTRVASLGDLAAPEPVAGPNVTIVDADVDSDLVDGRLPVRSAEEARQLETAGRAYGEHETALEARLEALGDATVSLEAGDVASGEALNATVAAHGQYRESVDELREQLDAVADSGVGSARHAAALAALAEREAATENATAERAREHDRALRDRERSLTRALRLRVLGGSLLGLLAGALLGAALPLYRGRAARRRLDRGEWTTYSRRTALLPAIAGLVLLLAGLGWLALEVGWQLLEVVT